MSFTHRAVITCVIKAKLPVAIYFLVKHIDVIGKYCY